MSRMPARSMRRNSRRFAQTGRALLSRMPPECWRASLGAEKNLDAAPILLQLRDPIAMNWYVNEY
jgi:hypothetical protein